MTKATHIRVGGSWKQVNNVWQRVSGEWKEEVIPNVRVSGNWEECMEYQSYIYEGVLTAEFHYGSVYDIYGYSFWGGSINPSSTILHEIGQTADGWEELIINLTAPYKPTTLVVDGVSYALGEPSWESGDYYEFSNFSLGPIFTEEKDYNIKIF